MNRPRYAVTGAVTVAAVNAAIKAAGGAEKLTRGGGYYYFRDGDAAAWARASVYVSHVDALSIAEWLTEWRECKATSWSTVPSALAS